MCARHGVRGLRRVVASTRPVVTARRWCAARRSSCWPRMRCCGALLFCADTKAERCRARRPLCPVRRPSDAQLSAHPLAVGTTFDNVRQRTTTYASTGSRAWQVAAWARGGIPAARERAAHTAANRRRLSGRVSRGAAQARCAAGRLTRRLRQAYGRQRVGKRVGRRVGRRRCAGPWHLWPTIRLRPSRRAERARG